MTLSRTLQAGAAAALFFLGSAALADEHPGTTEVSKSAPRTARATGANGSGQTSGPATGTNVQPTPAPAAAGEPGKPGFPGNKNGPAVMPPKQQEEGQHQQGK